MIAIILAAGCFVARTRRMELGGAGDGAATARRVSGWRSWCGARAAYILPAASRAVIRPSSRMALAGEPVRQCWGARGGVVACPTAHALAGATWHEVTIHWANRAAKRRHMAFTPSHPQGWLTRSRWAAHRDD